MWQVLIKIVEKFACKHEWVIIIDETEQNRYPAGGGVSHHRLLLKCKRCGKLKKVVM